jgi:serine/threonine protein kinase
MVGTELASRYRIEKVLGEGGMGRVFEAVDSQLGRRVALKVIREELVDPVSRKRFFREARAAAALSHPNACQLYEIEEHEAQPFLVMELLEGEPLSARLERGPLSKEDAIELLLPLMDALGAMHGAGLVHRDLKPSNVFLTEQGVKLLDFGLARGTERSDNVTVSALTVPGAVTGTMRYMAPEQLTGDPVDARTDIFALGVMLFEMVTGRIPFGAESNVDWLQAVLRDDPPSVEDPALKVLDPIISRALQRRPADRYERIDEMASELRAALEKDTDTSRAEVGVKHDGASGTSAVVLPFRVLPADPEIAILEQSLPEELTGRLSKQPDLRVLSNRVAQQFGDAPDLVAVGETLGVDRLVTGSILRAGNDVKVTVQLVDAGDGAVRWSQTSEHVMTSVLALQNEIGQHIIDGLLASLGGDGAPAAAEDPGYESAPGAMKP